ncbi:MAG: hypothetical protein U1B79_00940 [Candidatus Pacearchaeota archaeon]|nr:hypothetical protein [Nanoarchaeota archaeon]MDZ4226656.1 hypothetical protein [Candidatus Pacearchaeota archaeon]
MPKKKKEKPEKEEELEELAAMLKENNDSVEQGEELEESELEEDVDDSNLNLQNLEFHQFMQLQESRETGSPVLERIAGSVPRPIFVGGIPREAGTAAGGGADSNDEFKYVPGASENGEKKYFAEPEMESSPERVDFTRAGRTGFGFKEEINQERFFMQSEPRMESQSSERFERAERFATETGAGKDRRDQFKRPEEKYEKYRPKLPKS